MTMLSKMSLIRLSLVGYSLSSTQGGLYSPYDAKIIGDYTGITPPQNK